MPDSDPPPAADSAASLTHTAGATLTVDKTGWRVRQLRHRFWTKNLSVTPHVCRVFHSAWCPCVLPADWCLRSDVISMLYRNHGAHSGVHQHHHHHHPHPPNDPPNDPFIAPPIQAYTGMPPLLGNGRCDIDEVDYVILANSMTTDLPSS